MTLVAGDPASLSAGAVVAATGGRRVADLAAPLEEAVTALGVGWPGRVSVQVRRSASLAAGSCEDLAAELALVARALQDHASDLADLHARERAVRERAAAAGLEVRDGRVVPVYGVLGEADAAAAAAREGTAARLQADLDLVLAQHRRRRDFLLTLLRESATRLDGTSTRLRRGP